MNNSLTFTRSVVMNFFLGALYVLFYSVDAGETSFVLPLLFVLTLLDPRTIPWASVLVVSALQDILSGYPLGLHGVLYGIYGIFLISQRQFLFKKAFFLTWVAFALTSVGFLVLREILVFLCGNPVRMPWTLATQWGFLVVLFPLFFQGITWMYVRMRVVHESA